MIHGKIHKDLIEEIVRDYCPKPGCYCILKEIMMRTDPRSLIQLKCLEVFKFERSRVEKREIGWDEAMDLWVKEGYAERFDGIYKDGISPVEGYIQTMNGDCTK